MFSFKRVSIFSLAIAALFAEVVFSESPTSGMHLFPDTPTAGKHGFSASSIAGEEHAFAAEVTKMMDIIIHSLYKSKEIFLRELIANASDALDKRRQLGLTNKDLVDGWTPSINIRSDPVARTLTIKDSGVGMTKEEMTSNLGTIARSGTKEFIKQFSEKSDSNQIGQFGVGFYSSFLAGNLVQVISKTHGGEKHLWECDIRKGTFTIGLCPEELDAEDPIATQGTKVIIHLNPVDEDSGDYTSESTLKDLVHRYSEFINFPIYLYTRKEIKEEVPLTDSEQEAESAKESEAKANAGQSSEEDLKVEDATEDKKPEEDKEKKPKTKTVTRTEAEYALVNSNKPIWTREPSEVTNEEYVEFYKNFTKDTKEPFDYSHFKVSGSTTDFRGIIYIPKTPSFQLLSNDQPVDFVKLFVKRVFISSDIGEFPRYLSFIKTTVDAEEIPLNVSRETLQKTKVLRDIKKSLISKTLALLNKMAKNETLYAEFYKVYSNNLKLGVISETEDSKKKDLAGLLRFHSSAIPSKNMTSFDEYISRMKPNQTEIYFVSGTDVSSLKKLPYVESLLNRGLEVLLMVDTYDEYTIQALPSYQDKTLKNVAKGGIKFADETEDDKKKLEESTTRFKPLMDYLQKMFSTKIEKVVISTLLDKSPMAIVANSFGWSPAMEKLMSSNSGGPQDMMSNFFKSQKKIMEINPSHPLMEGLLSHISASSSDDVASSSKKQLDSDIRLLYDAALLHSGYDLKNPASFAHRVEDMIRAKYGVEPLPEEVKAAAEKIEDVDLEAENPFGSMGGMGGMGGMGDMMGGAGEDFDFSKMPDFGSEGGDDPLHHSEGENPASEGDKPASEGEKKEL